MEYASMRLYSLLCGRSKRIPNAGKLICGTLEIVGIHCPTPASGAGEEIGTTWRIIPKGPSTQ